MNMIKALSLTPKYWLTRGDSSRIFADFRKKVAFSEPIPPFDTRFEGRLEGILSSISQTYNHTPLNRTVLEASAAYFNQIIRGHPFRNGNKRMAVLFTHYFLLAHKIDFGLSFNELFHFAVRVARAGEEGISSNVTKRWCIKIIGRFAQVRER